MNDYLALVVVGLAAGSVYALAGLGLVVTYKTSGIFNFAHGTVGAAGAYAFYELHVQHGWPWPLSLVACVTVVGPALGLLLEHLARLLAPAAPSAKIVASIGLLLAIRGVSVARYGESARAFPVFLPSGRFDLFGVSIGVDQVILFVVAAVVGGLLSLFFRHSPLGVAMRGVVDNAELVALAGTNPRVVRRLAWLIGADFAVLAGILIAPQIGLDATLLTLLVVQAFGGAALGRFSSLPLTYVGCLAVGVVAALSTRLVLDLSQPALVGLPPSVPFIVLFGVLLLSPPSGHLDPGTRPSTPWARPPRPAWLAPAGVAATAAILVAAPALASTRLPVFTSGLVHVIVFASLAVLVRTSGQVSLCHAGFLAFGASTFSHLASGFGWPWFAALLATGLATVPLGLAVAVPAIRLSGLYLALATFGFGILLQRLLYTTWLMFGRASSIAAPRPSFAAGDRAYYYLVLALVAAACGVVYQMRRTRSGRLLRAMADSPVALSTGGTNVNVTKAIVFAVSAFLAGMAGALIGPITGNINGTSFDPFNSLLYLTVLAIAGRGEVRAAFVAAGMMVVLPAFIDSGVVNDYLPIVFGVAAIVASVPRQGLSRAEPEGWVALQRTSERVGRSPVRDRLLAAGGLR